MTATQRSALLGSSATRGVALAILLIDLVVAAVAWRGLRADRRAEYDKAERSSANLARMLAENLEGTISRIDLALRVCGDALATAAAPDRRVGEVVGRVAAHVPFLDAIRATDERGLVVLGPGVDPTALVSVADRDYWLAARGDPSGRMTVSSPLVGRISGKWSIIFSRAVRAPDGAFRGVVYAPATLEQFTRALSLVKVGRDGAVVLRGADDAVVARYPEAGGAGSFVGHRRVSAELKALVASQVAEASYVGASPIDGKEKAIAFRRVAGSPFYVLVAESSDAFLEGWRAEATRTVAAVVLFALVTALAAGALLASLRRESDARFRTLVLEAPIAMALTRGTRVVYANRAFLRTFGIDDPQAALGRSIVDHVHPGDVPALAERLDRRMRGLPVEPTTELTLLRPGGSFRASVTDASVDFDGRPAVVGFIQDVTERSRSDAERERLIADLQQALAEVKTLSGLLPICAHCKKIRDDRGYWSRIETYIRERSNAEFTHGICPDCAREFFGEACDVERERRPT